MIEGSRPIALLDHDPRRAIRDEAIVCLICGRSLRQLTNTHLRLHGTGPEAYRREFGYNARRSLMCHRLRRLYSERAVRCNLAGRIRQCPVVLHPELRRRGGRRALAWEEVLTRFESRHAGRGRPGRDAAAARGGP